ncbi:hypothetical protein TrCOL_g2539 [Triparma columacea]|uniref:Uncharacterized protein n=1 Tax=Triparma columacea TaxID=722753 RepID=A0A9W7L852_9STRA|nr:hypothetical protein TrCOL_g2539 [Triparma columacea]
MNLVGLEDKITTYCGNTRKFIARAWYVVLFFSFINVICSFCVLAQSPAGEGFAAFWSMSMVVSVAVGGTAVFRKYQTEAAVGFLLGTTAMMAQLFFMMFCVFASYKPELASASATDATYAAFSFFLMLSYMVLSISLFKFRADLLPKDPGLINAVVTGGGKPGVATTAAPTTSV